jgi:hypothetical protein
MNAAGVSRLIALIPERVARGQTGSLFDAERSARGELLSSFLGWLAPLNPISKEEQQILGVRGGSAKPMMEGEEPGDDALEADELDEAPVRLAGAGTQIAA